MRYYYAQIEDGACVGVIDAHTPITAPDMLPIQGFDPSLIGQVYDAELGTFAPPSAD